MLLRERVDLMIQEIGRKSWGWLFMWNRKIQIPDVPEPYTYLRYLAHAHEVLSEIREN